MVTEYVKKENRFLGFISTRGFPFFSWKLVVILLLWVNGQLPVAVMIRFGPQKIALYINNIIA